MTHFIIDDRFIITQEFTVKTTLDDALNEIVEKELQFTNKPDGLLQIITRKVEIEKEYNLTDYDVYRVAITEQQEWHWNDGEIEQCEHEEIKYFHCSH